MPAASPAPPVQPPANPWPVLIVICLGFFMIMLDTTIVYVATPNILTGLHASLDQVLWVFNGYLLAYAVLLITAGRLADTYGPRNLFMAGLAVFTLASALCGLAQDSSQLIAARVLQGVGGALLAPQSLTLLTALFPPQRRGAALGIWGAVVGLSTVAGPTLGGLIVTYSNWRWIFFLNLPVGVVALLGAFLIVPDWRSGAAQRLDLPGVLLASLGLLALVFGLVEGQRYEWGQVWGPVSIPVILATGGLLLAVFVAWESRQHQPLVPLRLFRNRNYALMNWTGLAMQLGMQAIFIPISIYLQTVLGMSALASGLTIAPMSLAAAMVAPFSGRLADRIGGKYILMLGLALFGLGAAAVAGLAGTGSTSLTFLAPLLVTGVGLGCVFAPMTTLAMHDITPELAAAASGVLNTTRQLGSVIGAALVGAVLQNQLAGALHNQALTASSRLPIEYRQGFVDGFARAARAGLQVGAGQSGGAQLPADLPAPARQLMTELIHQVFVNAYVTAMRPTVAVAVVVLLVASLSCVLVQGRRATRAQAQAEQLAVA